MFKPSIVNFSSVTDCKMIINELQQQLQSQFANDQSIDLATILELLEAKKVEVESRYSR